MVYFVIVHFICAYMYNSITWQQNDFLSINGHQKLMKRVNLKIVNFKEYTIHHSHFDYEKVPKQDEQVSLLS